MLTKNIFLILISLSLQLLIEAELPRNKFVHDGDRINEKTEALEREIAKLKSDNRYLRLKLDKVEQKATTLEQKIESLNRTNNNDDLGNFLTQLRTENMNFKTSLFNCLLSPQSDNTQNQTKLKTTPAINQEIPNEQLKMINYDEHFNCIENCEKTSETPKTCAEALAINRTGDGVYQLYAANSNLKAFYVYCIQDAYSDNAWMIIQRRQHGNINFVRNWTDYLLGFGDLNGDYWLGLEHLHALTTARKYELWIQMKDNAGEGRYASYSEFRIGNQTENFKLAALGEYTGDAGNSLAFNYDAPFSTYDRDNDSDEENNCAEKRMSGWWFKDCRHSLNGIYNSTDYGAGINWIGWHNYRYSLKYVHVAIRPVSVDLMKRTSMVIKLDWGEP